MKVILFLLTIVLVDDIVLSASLLPKGITVKQDVVKEINHSVTSARKSHQLWAPPVVFLPGYINHRYWPYQSHLQLYRRNQPFYETIENIEARIPFKKFNDSAQEKSDHLKDDEEMLSRQNLFGLPNINSVVNPTEQWMNLLPVVPNPDNFFLSRIGATCTDSYGRSGICILPSLCALYGGVANGFCGIACVCCVNTISKCGGQMTLNNTYWESPTFISSESSCPLTVTLQSNFIEQRRPICQVRLDFYIFSISQPLATSKCDVDKFIVGGAVNKVPVICGDNGGQHMYLEANPLKTNMQLLFNFGVSSIERSWKMKIALLPCGASFLAPKDCLQYLTSAFGSVKSFNWLDATGVRQLANQEYKVCFRNELVNDKLSVSTCLTQCSTSRGGQGFRLSGNAATSLVGPGVCDTDFLLLLNGFNDLDKTQVNDRYCGGALNAGPAGGAATTVCSNAKSFNFVYVTNDAETGAEAANSGFCFDFVQRL